MDQGQAPVLDALAGYRLRRDASFAPPGHRQGRGVDPRVTDVLGRSVFAADIVAAELDARHHEGEALLHAEQLMAEAVHAAHTFFSTCGSSLSVKAAMLAAAGPGEKLIIGRDVHKSVASGLILSGIQPVWANPSWDADLHLAHPPQVREYAAAFAEAPDAMGALVTSPTPYGAAADVAALAELCHHHGRPLIVDEAWGAHLPFHPDLPAWAMDAGADVCVTSVHKMGSGLEQGSVFHLQGDLIDPIRLRTRAELLSTTSPSVLLYAALDGWRRQMTSRGHELIDAALHLVAGVRRDIEAIDGMHVHDRADFCGPGKAFDLDPLQVVIDVAGLGVTGYQAADWLGEESRIGLHVADHRRISAQFSFADDAVTAETLLTALHELSAAARRMPLGPTVDVPDPGELRLPQAMRPRDAFFAETEAVPASEAAGRICAEVLTPYPPGIPAALPGEQLNEAVLDYMRSGVQAGMVIPDAADHKLTSVRVVTRDAARNTASRE
jgi:arginine decarboxylase